MTIWILALILIGLFVAAGYFQGGISATVTLLCLILAGFLALPLAPLVKPVFTGLGITTNTVWLWLLPPVLVVVLLVLISFGLGFAAYRPVSVYYKYKSDDLTRHHFERLNARLGACVGLVNGAVALLLAGVAIYVPGYLTVQFANETSDPAWLRFLNSARADMQTTGFDRIVRPFDPAPKNYYQIADMLGVVYQNNPAIIGHLADYPPFLSLGERQELKDVAADKELMENLQGKASLADLIKNDKILGLINNADFTQELFKLDLKDMEQYIKTGKSAKYDPVKILGRWELDVEQVILTAKKTRPNIKASELSALRKVMSTMSAGTTFKATTDNKLVLTTRGMMVDLNKLDELRAASQAAAAAAAAPAPRPRLGSMTSIPANLRARYGMGYGGPPAAPAEPAPAAATPTPLKMEEKTLQGSWEGEGESYQLKIADDKGRQDTPIATIEGDELTFTLFGQPLAFARQM